MKRFLLLMTVVLSALSMQAQRTITGKVVDEANEAVIQATVSLLKTDSTSVTHAVTNMNGQYTLTAPADFAGSATIELTNASVTVNNKSKSVDGASVTVR